MPCQRVYVRRIFDQWSYRYANATYMSFTVVVEVVFENVLQVFRCEDHNDSAEAFSARDRGERVLQSFVVVFFLRMQIRTLTRVHSKKMQCCYDSPEDRVSMMGTSPSFSAVQISLRRKFLTFAVGTCIHQTPMLRGIMHSHQRTSNDKNRSLHLPELWAPALCHTKSKKMLPKSDSHPMTCA